MTAFSRPITGIAAAVASLMAVSAANAMPVAKPAAAGVSSNLVKVHDRYDRDDYHRHHGRHYRDRDEVVHAPLARVESGRRTIVDAPFVHVYSGRHGTHVVAPFVNYWD
jgi:hypothetical protein